MHSYICTDFYSDSEQLSLNETKKAKTSDEFNGNLLYVIFIIVHELKTVTYL